ncbi:MAG: lipoyl(octanoyl) transferase LipB [Chloroflexi bacterium]|nr:lipoyl(octanoyl) transferase LipB [Chloroflexota bacterium]
MRSITLVNLGLTPYADALALQHTLVEQRKRGAGRDTLLLLEHPPVFTLGRNARPEHILASREFLDEIGIEVHRVERGGDVTYHGPGQLVGYPILDLHKYRMDVGWYVRSLEDVLIQTLGGFGLDAHRAGLNENGNRDPKLVGVWVENPTDDPTEKRIHAEAKIAQIGARIESWITYHGFALNVDPQMEHFNFIVPCGIPDKPVTSLARALKQPISMDDVRARVATAFAKVFAVTLRHD